MAVEPHPWGGRDGAESAPRPADRLPVDQAGGGVADRPAGAAALSEHALRGGRLRPDPAAAKRAALAFLRRTGESATVTVTGDRVTVQVRTSIRTGLLGLIGKQRFAVAATATARPVRALGPEVRGLSNTEASSGANRSAGDG